MIAASSKVASWRSRQIRLLQQIPRVHWKISSRKSTIFLFSVQLGLRNCWSNSSLTQIQSPCPSQTPSCQASAPTIQFDSNSDSEIRFLYTRSWSKTYAIRSGDPSDGRPAGSGFFCYVRRKYCALARSPAIQRSFSFIKVGRHDEPTAVPLRRRDGAVSGHLSRSRTPTLGEWSSSPTAYRGWSKESGTRSSAQLFVWPRSSAQLFYYLCVAS